MEGSVKRDLETQGDDQVAKKLKEETAVSSTPSDTPNTTTATTSTSSPTTSTTLTSTTTTDPTTTSTQTTTTPAENQNNNTNKNNNNNNNRGRGRGRGGGRENPRGRKGKRDWNNGDKKGEAEVEGGGGEEDEEEQEDEVAQAPRVVPDVDVETLQALPIDPNARKKKVAMLIGYNGAGYYGMQRNPGVKTIEDDMEVAIYKAGGISKDNFRDLTKVDWMRCARTDKGVSALGNVVSFKLLLGPPDLQQMQERINQCLDPSIRVFSIRRVNKKFNAKYAVNARSYEYLYTILATALINFIYFD